MSILHDAAYRTQLESRVKALTDGAERRWGRMSVDQMLWHVNDAMEVALGRRATGTLKPPLPAAIMKFIVLKMPWSKGAPTLPILVATERHDFSAERDRCVRLMGDVASRPLDGPWPVSPILGKVTGQQASRLQAKHIDHHLKQFGV